jgi:LPS-assembly protein
VSLLSAAPALAQQASCTPPAGGARASNADMFKEQLDATGAGQFQILPDRIRLLELVELPVPCQPGTRISADLVEIFFERGVLEASGNVVFVDSEGRIAAEKVEFDLEKGTGTFHWASGLMTLGPGANRAEFGNQDPDVYFNGEIIEKLGPQKYRITRGGFTTCVQPEPRWEFVTQSVVINLNDYALARNLVLRVKGVPLLYLPLLYYPIQDDGRATGFLMPTYGVSTLRGGSISNAFFWAINRSQDATVFHDWFARAGQGVGGEYRYASLGGAGEVRFYQFAQREHEYTVGDRVGTLPESTSYEVMASMVHGLARGLRARARVEYASDLLTRQLYQQSLYNSTNPSRTVEGGLSGAWGPLSVGALYQRIETFSNSTQSRVNGSTPRLNAAIAPTRLFGAPVYGSVDGEFAYLPNRIHSAEQTTDLSLARFDLAPTLRVPLTRLSYLSVNTNAAYRTTYYSHSSESGSFVPVPLARTYFTVRSDVIGPVFNKIWDTPASVRTERMKHVIEPGFTVDYITEIDNASSLPTVGDQSDVVVGRAARLTYGLTNRFLYRTRTTGAAAGSSHEFLSINLQQTYYSNNDASRFDPQYSGSTNRVKSVDLSPIALTARFSPGSAVSANTRVEYDVSGLGMQTVSLGGSVNSSSNTANVSYSRVNYSTSSQQYLTASNSLRLAEGRATASYALNWDLGRAYIVSQSVTVAYLAQCCGIQMEYQQYNFPELTAFPVSADRRFNFGVVLAGLGTFSNFFGAFGGQP